MKKFVGAFLAVLLIVVSGYAQTPFFQSYFLLRKNDRIQVNVILQDQKGFMWFGTTSGLFRFDGKKQQQFTTSSGLPSDVITALAQDSLGRIWIGYQNGKLGFLEHDKINFFDPPEGTSSQPISDILFDKNGNLWFSTFNDGLYYLTQNRLHRVDDAEGLPDLYVYDLWEDDQGNVWAGTDAGIAICALTSINKISVKVIDYDSGLPDNIIRKIVPEKNGETILLATEDAGIVRYDLKSGKNEPIIKTGWQYGPVSDFVLKENKIWIACPQKGLLIYDQSSSDFVIHGFGSIPGFNSLRILTKDREGNVWAGTKSGLLRTPGDNLEYLEKPVPERESNTLAVTIDQNDNIWFSNARGLFKRKLYSQNEIVSDVLRNTPYGKYTVISLYVDSKGYIWAGLYGEGALRIHPQSGKIHHFSKELRNGNILSIAGSENVIWLATLGGVSQINISDNELNVKNYSTADGLASDFIYQVFVQKERVWFATDGKGLAMWDHEGFHQYMEGLPNPVVYGMAEDSNHNLWVNVQGSGLYTFDGKNFHPGDSSLLLREKEIHCLASDKSGNIVVMHDAGMDIIDVNQRRLISLGEEVGLRDKIANLNAVGRDSNGNLFFGTTEGIVKYSGDKKSLALTPTPLIEAMTVFDMPVDLRKASALKHDQNNVTINYLGIWYKNPDALFYSYKLDNYDLNWINTSNLFVTYSQLPPGRYTFRMKVSETANFKGATEAAVSFSILPPFWRTVPFYLLSVISVVALVYLVIKSRERKLRKYNELLEATVKLRTQEIQLQNEEIQAQNEEISAQSEEILGINENLEHLVRERTAELERKNKALEEYAFINAHKLRSPVATILGLLNLLPKTDCPEERKEINHRLHHTAYELDSIVSSITKAIERGFRKSTRRNI
jgi:ligand-binding sensor domain-containing protein